MSLRIPVPLRFLTVLATVVALAAPALPALAQSTTTTTMISIDAPTDAATIRNGQQIDVGGWAADTAGPGTGVDMVRVYLDGRMDAGGTLGGNANYGGNRPDVAQALGSANYTNSGFDLLWTPNNLSNGAHMLYVYAHSVANGWAYKTVNVTVEGAPAAAPARSGGMGGYGGGYGGMGGYGGGYGGYGGGYGGYGNQQMTPYGGTYLNQGYGSGGYGAPCNGLYDFYNPSCSQFPQLPPPPPPYGYGGGYGGGLPYQQTVTVVAPPGGTVVLSWIASPTAVSYRIYQAPATAPQNFTVVQTVTQTSAILASTGTVTGLTPGQTYYFQVRSVDFGSFETVVPAFSNAGSGLFPGYPGFPYPGIPGGLLPPPTGVTVTGVTGTTVTLTWAAVPGAITYRVFQALGNTNAFQPSVMSNSTATSAVISGLSLSTLYSFQVIALDNFGNQSQPSVIVTATTTAGP